MAWIWSKLCRNTFCCTSLPSLYIQRLKVNFLHACNWLPGRFALCTAPSVFPCKYWTIGSSQHDVITMFYRENAAIREMSGVSLLPCTEQLLPHVGHFFSGCLLANWKSNGTLGHAQLLSNRNGWCNPKQ